jgi:hypothetical protein
MASAFEHVDLEGRWRYDPDIHLQLRRHRSTRSIALNVSKSTSRAFAISQIRSCAKIEFPSPHRESITYPATCTPLALRRHSGEHGKRSGCLNELADALIRHRRR